MIPEELQMEIFNISNKVRYVAIYHEGRLVSSERPGIKGASSSESDKYEELIVNPTLLKLVIQRGNIDCGGAEYVIIRYGLFFELVIPAANGHVSVGIESDADLMQIVLAVVKLTNQAN